MEKEAMSLRVGKILVNISRQNRIQLLFYIFNNNNMCIEYS